MKLQELLDNGGLTDGAPITKQVTWKRIGVEDVTFEVGVRRLSAGEWEEIQTESEDRPSASARIISRAIVLEDGVRFTYEQAYQLDPGLATVLLNAHTEVNRRPAKKA